MDFFNVLALLGGLAVFLYGMNTMGDGLAKATGGKMEAILEKLTSNRLMAVLLGAGVTAVIQSSSATTVMVVGFVNSGIMRLSQAVGIIFGANIGTTVTAWVLSLAGLESNNVFIQLLKPSSFSPILALIGVVFLLFSKKEKKKELGTIFIGFALLMFGMEMMSDSMSPLQESEKFASFFTMFSNPILGLLAGATLTAIIQSSSASVGILQALCTTGKVGYSSALPIILGQNIGTCVTALLSSIGASKNAKRAAIIHLYFNILGTVSFMVIFYGVNYFVDFSFMSGNASEIGIAIIHTVFNVTATFALLPFAGFLEKLAIITIKDNKKPEEEIENVFQLLDERFLEKPAFAVEQCKKTAVNMAYIAKNSVELAIELLVKYDEDKVRKIQEMETLVDKYEDELGGYLVKLSAKSLSEVDSRTVSKLLHSIGDFERISDHSLNLLENVQEMKDKKLAFSEHAAQELVVFTNAIKEIMDLAMDCFTKESKEIALLVEPLEEVIDNLNDELKIRHIERLRNRRCTIELGFILSDLTTDFERIADHCSNIAVCELQMNEAKFETHDYLENIRVNDLEFKEKYKEFSEQYILP